MIGQVAKDGSVLYIRRIEVTYALRAAAEHAAVIDRVHAMHADHCPVARTLRGAVEIVTRLERRDP